MIGRAFRLDSIDVEPSFSRSAAILSRLTVGDRDDWAWARVEPAIRVGPHRSLSTPIDLAVIAIAPRHLYATWEDGPWPLHVYVCRAIDPNRAMAEVLLAGDLSIEYWATATAIDDGHVMVTGAG